MKRLLCLLLIFVLLVPYIGIKAEAAISGTCGSNLTWSFDTSTGMLTISGTGAMQDYTGYAPWYGLGIREVVIKSGVTTIGNCAFFDCTLLTQISLPTTLTSIGIQAFYGCSSLVSVNIPAGVINVGNGAFMDCVGLTRVTIPGSVTSVGDEAFAYCNTLKNVLISDGVTKIGFWSFNNCDSLTSVSIPGSVVVIDQEAFSSCDKLMNVTICEGVKEIGEGAFEDCKSLKNLTIPESVIRIGDGAFSGCKMLTDVTIPSGVTSIRDNVFFDCDSLTKIVVPVGVTSIGDGSFGDCDGIISVIIPNTISSIGYGAFHNCIKLEDISIPRGVPSIEDETFAGCGNLKRVVLGEGVKSIGMLAFAGCSSLVRIMMPSSVSSIGGEAFSGCSALADIHYSGTLEDRTKIKVSYENEAVYNAQWHYEVIHDHEYRTTVIAPTCTKIGYTIFECSICGHSYTGNETQVVGHRLADWTEYSEATCTNVGEERRECGLCDYYESRVIPVKDHTYTLVVTEPTCTMEGYTTYTCACGDSYMGDKTPKADHIPGQWQPLVPASCTHTGTEIRFCTNCTWSETRETELLDHSYTAEVTAPTCTEAGYTTYTCTCGDSYTADEVAATGHEWGQWHVNKTPTTVEAGEQERVCNTCGAVDTQMIPVVEEELTAPVITVSAVTSTGKTKLTWEAVSGADFYRIYRATSRTGKYTYQKSTRSTSYTDNDAVVGQNYYYKVLAVAEDTGVTSEFSNIVNRCCDLPVPEVTLSVKTSTGKPVVKWNTVEGAEKYRVYRSEKKTSGYSLVYTTSVNRSYTDTAAEAGINYYYKVKAIHTNSSADSAYSEVVNRVCDLAKPTVSISYNSTSGKPVVKWETVEGAAKYYVYRSTSKSSGFKKVYTGVTSRPYTDTTAVAGTNYYYKVMAVHTNASANSAYSEVVNRVCDLAKPVISVTLSGVDPKVTWETVEGAEKYEIWRSTSKSGEYQKVKTAITARSFTDTTAKAGTKYYYKVRAIHSNSAANSAYSSVKYITAK